jgi:hypothetical protein
MTSEIIDIADLDTLLEQERTLLIEGKLERLGTLLPKKEKLVEQLLGNHELSRDVIAPLEKKLLRNQLLLDGALDGIRSVSARLAALRQVRIALDTYDAQGRKRRVITPTKPQVEKRA